MRARLTPTVCAERLPGPFAYREAIEALHGRLRDLCSAGQVQRRGLVRIEAVIDPDSVPCDVTQGDSAALSWLSSVPAGRRILFRSRDGLHELAGMGWALLTHDWQHPALNGIVTGCEGRRKASESGAAHGPLDPAALVLEPFRNGHSAGEAWRDFETTRIVVPAVEWRAMHGVTVLAVNGVGAAAPALEALAELIVAAGAAAAGHAAERKEMGKGDSAAVPPQAWRVSDDGDPSRWADAVDAALAAIGAGRIEKVVLARTRRYVSDAMVDPVHVMRLLRAEEPDAYHLLFECGAGRAFVAASPERLFSRVGRTVRSEAVAGTCARGPDDPSDRRLADRLL
ncbi:MAG: hypothetical protein FGM37_06095, partial [Phycisphaerales bacterium]|nr:hypothetical protein [Phycisphaerales bacterium]